MSPSIIAGQAGAFFEFLENWQKELPILSLSQAVIDPSKTAIITVDVIKGFCSVGPLASARVSGIIHPIADLFQNSWNYGVRHILLIQDTHEPEAVEFSSYPPHCIRGTEEADTVDEVKSLPFFDQVLLLPKNSISSDLSTGFNTWQALHPEVDTYITVGDCTDLCTYQLAMHLRLQANANQMRRRVILPVDCVDTYDTPVEIAQKLGIFAHPADLIHPFFLYHMAMNGIEIVAHIG
jgi:nicotinamidase-related amidase